MSVHVAYVLRSFPVLSQVTVINELRALEEMGVRTTVVPLLPSEYRSRSAEANQLRAHIDRWWEVRRSRALVLRSNVAAIALSGVQHYHESRRRVEEIGLLQGLRAFGRLTDLALRLRACGVQHLHAHFATEATTVTQVLSTLSGLPFSFTAHAYDIFLRPHRLGEKLRAARFVVTVSEYNKRYLLEKYPGVDAERIHVVRPGVDTESFLPAHEASVDGSRLRIFSVGRLVEKKGYADLVEACRLLADRGVDFECTIAGGGPQQASLEQAVASRGLKERVRLLGAMPHEQLVARYRQADVFVLPCVVAPNGDRDAMPLATEEAMASGLPTISTRVSGIPELVRDGAGLLVPPHDPQALSQALVQVYRIGPEGRAAMGWRGRAIVEEHFNMRNEARKLLALFET